jgi:tetratricopeptide (TPR) repeat protein
MIVRDEERQLAECLEPVAPLFDEIVIIDTGSRDRTKEIAGRFTSCVFDHVWEDDFSVARNETLRRANGEWIFWLDADDRLDQTNVAKLRGLLGTLDEHLGVYIMETACPAAYACEGTCVISHPRLFRRHSDLHWEGRVHEQLRPDFGALGYETHWSDIRIEHVGYQDPALYQRKLHRDVRLLRMDYAVNPDNASTLVHLGTAYYHLGRWSESKQYLQRLLTRNQPPGDHLRQVYAVLASISLREGALQSALGTLQEGLSLFPSDAYLLYLKADCLYELDEYEDARQTLVHLLATGDASAYQGGTPGDIRSTLAPRKLGDVLRLQRMFSAAEAVLQQVVDRFPADTLSWHTLGRVYIDARRKDQLKEVVSRLLVCPQGEIFGSLLLASWHLLTGDLPQAGALIDRLIGQAPQMPMPRVLRAELLARICAPIPQRIAALKDVLRVQPGNADAQRVLNNLQWLARRETSAQPIDASVLVGANVPGGLSIA